MAKKPPIEQARKIVNKLEGPGKLSKKKRRKLVRKLDSLLWAIDGELGRLVHNLTSVRDKHALREAWFAGLEEASVKRKMELATAYELIKKLKKQSRQRKKRVSHLESLLADLHIKKKKKRRR